MKPLYPPLPWAPARSHFKGFLNAMPDVRPVLGTITNAAPAPTRGAKSVHPPPTQSHTASVLRLDAIRPGAPVRYAVSLSENGEHKSRAPASLDLTPPGTVLLMSFEPFANTRWRPTRPGVFRRYSDWEQLHDSLRGLGLKLPIGLPQKHVSRSRQALDARALRLTAYCNALLSSPKVLGSPGGVSLIASFFKLAAGAELCGGSRCWKCTLKHSDFGYDDV